MSSENTRNTPLRGTAKYVALRGTVTGLMLLALAGCNTFDRLSQAGSEPPLTEIQDPTRSPHYRPVSLPMPIATKEKPRANSLWRPGARAFFRDQRAAQIGDILTVEIAISDDASLNNSTTRTRTTSEVNAITNALGVEKILDNIMPKAYSPTSPISLSGDTSHAGTGNIARGETINVKLAAVVTQILPNGNLVVRGRQEVRVNYEVRDLVITGIVRREDISSSNTISYEKIAEARIAYGGRGQMSDVQQPRYGTQIFDIIYPF
jgi:flagellar L-ring protein FlgH